MFTCERGGGWGWVGGWVPGRGVSYGHELLASERLSVSAGHMKNVIKSSDDPMQLAEMGHKLTARMRKWAAKGVAVPFRDPQNQRRWLHRCCLDLL
jgi:hypothetical protein